MKLPEITLTNTHYQAIAVLLVAIAAAWWWYNKPAPAPIEQYTIAKVAPQVKAYPKVDIRPPQVKVYAEAAKRKLTLPAQIQQDQHQHVLAATAVPIDTHPQTVVTAIDDQTGEVQTFTRREPLPWLRAEQTGAVSLLYGYKNGRPIGRMMVREDLLQVKALHLTANAALDSDGQIFVGGGVSWGW